MDQQSEDELSDVSSNDDVLVAREPLRDVEAVVAYEARKRRAGAPTQPTRPNTGVRDEEVVLRGGFLRDPVILGGCRMVEGRKFMPLLKAEGALINFLTPFRQSDRPLKHTRIIERLQQLRNEAQAKLGHEPHPDGKIDPANMLEVEDAPRRKPSKKKRKTPQRVMPEIVDIVVEEAEGLEPWSVTVLVEKSLQVAPSIEATDANMLALFVRAQADMETALPPRQRYGADAPASERKAPKGPDGQKEYWIATAARWRRKLLVKPGPQEEEAPEPMDVEQIEDSGARSSRDKRIRYKVLTRKATDAGDGAKDQHGGALPPLPEEGADTFADD